MRSQSRPQLGQHFLTSEAFRRRVAAALPVRSDDLAVEIGPGRGAITSLVAARAAHVVAVEVDAGLAEILREKFAADPHIEIVTADILQIDFGDLCRRHGHERCFVFGNLPYYITSPILHHLMAAAACISGLAFVVQREVAERIVAPPGSRAYGYLSVLMQCHAKPKIAFNIPPGAFSPPPAVHSALVAFEMIEGGEPSDERRRDFLEFVKLSFARKRKTLVNNLAPVYAPERIHAVFHRLGLGHNVRAEELSVAKLRGLFEALAARDAKG